jgi:hypothetical protein
LFKLVATIPTGEEPIELLPPSEFVSHICVRLGDFLGRLRMSLGRLQLVGVFAVCLMLPACRVVGIA